jgi:hypothetical protein
VEAHVCQVFMCVGLPFTRDPPPSSPPFFRSSKPASLPWTCGTLARHQSLFPLRYSFLLPSPPHHTPPCSSVVLSSRCPCPSCSLIPLSQSLHEPLRTTLVRRRNPPASGHVFDWLKFLDIRHEKRVRIGCICFFSIGKK